MKRRIYKKYRKGKKRGGQRYTVGRKKRVKRRSMSRVSVTGPGGYTYVGKPQEVSMLRHVNIPERLLTRQEIMAEDRLGPYYVVPSPTDFSTVAEAERAVELKRAREMRRLSPLGQITKSWGPKRRFSQKAIEREADKIFKANEPFISSSKAYAIARRRLHEER